MIYDYTKQDFTGSQALGAAQQGQRCSRCEGRGCRRRCPGRPGRDQQRQRHAAPPTCRQSHGVPWRQQQRAPPATSPCSSPRRSHGRPWRRRQCHGLPWRRRQQQRRRKCYGVPWRRQGCSDVGRFAGCPGRRRQRQREPAAAGPAQVPSVHRSEGLAPGLCRLSCLAVAAPAHASTSRSTSPAETATHSLPDGPPRSPTHCSHSPQSHPPPAPPSHGVPWRRRQQQRATDYRDAKTADDRGKSWADRDRAGAGCVQAAGGSCKSRECCRTAQRCAQIKIIL